MVQLVLCLVAELNREHQTLQALRTMMRPLLASSGAVCCRIFVDPTEPRKFVYVEEWASDAELRRELRAERLRDLLSLMESSAAAPTLEFRTVTEVRGLDLVEEVRNERPSGGEEGP